MLRSWPLLFRCGRRHNLEASQCTVSRLYSTAENGSRRCPIKNIDPIVSSVYRWAQIWVHQFGLCPWAGSVLTNNKLKVYVNEGEVNENLLTNITLNIVDFVEGTLNAPAETAFVVVPDVHAFDEFLELVDDVETICKSTGLDSAVQIATFHPNYVFQESQEQDNVENYTNRSPFPILHLLKVDHVARVLESYSGNPDDIWRSNIKLLKKLGLKKVQEIHRGILNNHNATNEDS